MRVQFRPDHQQNITAMEGKCGGWTDERYLYPEIQKICDEVKSDVQKKLCKIFPDFTATCFISQVVAGVNYIIKIHVEDCVYVDVKVFQALPCEGGGLTVTGCQYPSGEQDPLKPF